MKYVALLRGVNVGGHSIIKMSELKSAVEKAGFTNVQTYIQSGNVVFESDEKNATKIVVRLEDVLKEAFKLDMRLALRTYAQLKKVVDEVPGDWETSKDLRCYIAFTREPTLVQDVIRDIELKDGIDFIKPGDGVVYMSSLLSGLTRSRINKIISKPIYKDITIRNFNTVQKLLALMEKK
jgi:uncharacterized protein (DUF1697 family)